MPFLSIAVNEVSTNLVPIFLIPFDGSNQKKKNETTISISFYVDAVEVDDDDDGGPKKRPILYQKKSKRKEKKIKIRPPPHFALMEAPRLHPKTKEKRPRIYL